MEAPSRPNDAAQSLPFKRPSRSARPAATGRAFHLSSHQVPETLSRPLRKCDCKVSAFFLLRLRASHIKFYRGAPHDSNEQHDHVRFDLVFRDGSLSRTHSIHVRYVWGTEEPRERTHIGVRPLFILFHTSRFADSTGQSFLWDLGYTERRHGPFLSFFS